MAPYLYLGSLVDIGSMWSNLGRVAMACHHRLPFLFSKKRKVTKILYFHLYVCYCLWYSFFWIINCIKNLRKSNSVLKDRYACWVHTQLSLRNYKKYRDILNSTKLDGLPSSTNSQER